MPSCATLDATATSPTAFVLADGHSVSDEQVLAGLHPDDVPLIMDSEIVSQNQEVLRRLAELPRNAGDCAVDYLQGIYWTAKNRELLAWETPHDLCDDAPIICCGSGPSLDAAIPALKELQKSYRIVCAHSTIERLLAADIIPDAYTPLERVAPAVLNMPMTKLPDSVIYAGLTVAPDEHTRCKSKMCVVSKGFYDRWMPTSGQFVSQGTMSGTLAAGVSLAMTTGPVYMIGHDLAFGHYTGYAYPENAATHSVECVDGVRRETDFYMYRAARELGGMGDGRLIQCAPTGAVISGCKSGSLDSLPAAIKSIRRPSIVAPWRPADFAKKLKRMPSEWRSGMLRAASAKTESEIGIHALWPDAENRDAFQLLLRPVYLALSIEKRLGRKSIALDWFKEILANMDYDVQATLEDMTHDC